MSTTPPTPPQTFDSAPHEPDGGVPFSGLVLTMLFSCGAALVVGAVVSVIHQWFYLVLLFPLFMGFLAGLAGLGGIRLGRVRNPLVAGTVGVLAGSLVMVATYFGDYLLTLLALHQQFPGGQVPDLTFPRFVDLRAEQGVTIGRLSQGNGMNLGYVGSYIYWLAEIVVAGAVAGAAMRLGTMAPFCPTCQTWKAARIMGHLAVERYTVTAIMDRGELLRLVDPQLPVGHPVQFTAHLCLWCEDQSSVEMSLKQVIVNAKGERKETALGTWTFGGETLPVWQSIFAPPPTNVGSATDEHVKE